MIRYGQIFPLLSILNISRSLFIMKIAEIISDVFHSMMPLKQNFSLKFSQKPVQEGFKHMLKHIMNPSGKVCTFPNS